MIYFLVCLVGFFSFVPYDHLPDLGASSFTLGHRLIPASRSRASHKREQCKISELHLEKLWPGTLLALAVQSLSYWILENSWPCFFLKTKYFDIIDRKELAAKQKTSHVNDSPCTLKHLNLSVWSPELQSSDSDRKPPPTCRDRHVDGNTEWKGSQAGWASQTALELAKLTEWLKVFRMNLQPEWRIVTTCLFSRWVSRAVLIASLLAYEKYRFERGWLEVFLVLTSLDSLCKRKIIFIEYMWLIVLYKKIVLTAWMNKDLYIS